MSDNTTGAEPERRLIAVGECDWIAAQPTVEDGYAFLPVDQTGMRFVRVPCENIEGRDPDER